MKISHGSRLATYTKRNGYGYVTDRMLKSLKTLGYDVKPNNPHADVNLWYDQPQHIVWKENQYRVAYHPWESTELLPGWKEQLNSADEVWTPSPLMKEWYEDLGITRPIYIYEHGVDKVWTCQDRPSDGIIRLLHVGGEAKRKGGDLVMDAYRAAFPDTRDVQLTMKMISRGMNVMPSGRIQFVTESMKLPRLVRLYHSHHVFVYPSWGEGFGLNPLQALATGMPTIFTEAWAPYAEYAPERWKVGSELTDSPWPFVHPGKMWKPNFDELVDKLRYVVENYDKEARVAQEASQAVHDKYDWTNLTREAFESLEKRVEKVPQKS